MTYIVWSIAFIEFWLLVGAASAFIISFRRYSDYPGPFFLTAGAIGGFFSFFSMLWHWRTDSSYSRGKENAVDSR